jgi:hypothetical protein
MLAHPSTELVARAPCQLRRAHARSVRAARARLRQQRCLEVDESRKLDAQTGAPVRPQRRPREAPSSNLETSRATFTLAFFSGEASR